MTRCFNGHASEHLGCDGCHYAFHVLSPGKVEGGELVPPAVVGPDTCDLCHEARHHIPVAGCPRCAGRVADAIHDAMLATEPVWEQIMQIKLQRWFASWQATMAGWFIVLGGGQLGGLYRGPDSAKHRIGGLLLVIGFPVLQWFSKRRITTLEKKLPSLGPHGEVIFGEGPDDGEDPPFRRK